MDNEKAPEWAKREFCNRAGLDYQQTFSSSFAVALQAAVKAGGRLIAEHEDPPVDPLLIEARNILASDGWWTEDNFELSRPLGEVSRNAAKSGEWDGHAVTALLLQALRHGMELARKENSHAG